MNRPSKKKEWYIKCDIRWIREPSLSYLDLWIMCCDNMYHYQGF